MRTPTAGPSQVAAQRSDGSDPEREHRASPGAPARGIDGHQLGQAFDESRGDYAGHQPVAGALGAGSTV